MNRTTARRLLEAARGARVIVMGDVILDEYVMGGASRLSPEAPVPVVEVAEVRVFPGGAANVALNTARLGASTLLIGVIGNDAEGARLQSLLACEERLQTVLIEDEGRPTTKKSRVVASGHQIVRFDHEIRAPLPSEIAGRVVAELKRHLDRGVGALVLSDYQKGVLCPEVLRTAIEEAKRQHVCCVVDPKLEDVTNYHGASVLTPNLGEARRAVAGGAGKSTAELLSALVAKLDGASVLITEGESGMTLLSPGGEPKHLKARLRQVFDRTGAGDTVVAVLSVALASGASLLEAAELANAGAGVAVSKPGVVAVEPEEILLEFDDG